MHRECWQQLRPHAPAATPEQMNFSSNRHFREQGDDEAATHIDSVAASHGQPTQVLHCTSCGAAGCRVGEWTALRRALHCCARRHQHTEHRTVGNGRAFVTRMNGSFRNLTGRQMSSMRRPGRSNHQLPDALTTDARTRPL